MSVVFLRKHRQRSVCSTFPRQLLNKTNHFSQHWSVQNTYAMQRCVSCMIRKNEGYNIPAMSKYLENSFPLIPTGWRMSIVVAIFTAVQKASAVHGDRAYSSSRRWWKDTVGTPIISTLGTWSLCRRAEEATK